MSREPTKPAHPIEDDDALGLPGLDGVADGRDEERGVDAPVELDVDDDASSALDDATAEDLEGVEVPVDDGDAGLDWDDVGVEPIDADPSLSQGDESGWTEGSETGESDPWDAEASADDENDLGSDRGEEGVDEPLSALEDGDAPPESDAALDADADDLDMREDGAIEAGPESSVLELPRVALPTTWLGPSGEPVRCVASFGRTVLVGARGLFEVREGALAPVSTSEHEGDVTSLARRGDELVVGTDAGEVFIVAPETGVPRRALPQPGTRDGSVGAVDVVALETAIVARTRGGALFRTSATADGWLGPIVPRSVRVIRGTLAGAASTWLLALTGTHSDSDELLVSEDAKRFERVPLPSGGHFVGVARAGNTIVLAPSEGAVLSSNDLGVTWTASPHVRDVQHVWLAEERGGLVLYASSFHEASDRGQLVRQPLDGAAVVVLDVAHEARARKLSGSGDPDGDGRIHDLAIDVDAERTVLWVATGVGLFRIEARA